MKVYLCDHCGKVIMGRTFTVKSTIPYKNGDNVIFAGHLCYDCNEELGGFLAWAASEGKYCNLEEEPNESD